MTKVIFSNEVQLFLDDTAYSSGPEPVQENEPCMRLPRVAVILHEVQIAVPENVSFSNPSISNFKV